MSLSSNALDVLFASARTHNGWLERPVSEAQLRQIWEAMKWGPTAANSSPARIVFVRGGEAKEKLLSCMAPGNIPKTRAAPVTAIIGMDLSFHELLPRLYPQAYARSWFAGNQPLIETTALRNSSLQGAYFIIAARALGLDCAPMSGFDAARLDEAFFAGTSVRVNFVCSLGYGDPARLYPRGPRLTFEEACRIV